MNFWYAFKEYARRWASSILRLPIFFVLLKMRARSRLFWRGWFIPESYRQPLTLSDTSVQIQRNIPSARGHFWWEIAPPQLNSFEGYSKSETAKMIASDSRWMWILPWGILLKYARGIEPYDSTLQRIPQRLYRNAGCRDKQKAADSISMKCTVSNKCGLVSRSLSSGHQEDKRSWPYSCSDLAV